MSESGLQAGDRIEASLLACERNIEAIKQKMLTSRQMLSETQDQGRRQELLDYQTRLKQKLNQELTRVRKLQDLLTPGRPSRSGRPRPCATPRVATWSG